MTVENRLIKEAKSKPDAIWINIREARTIAYRMRHSWNTHDIGQDEAMTKLKSGTVKILGVPIRVRGYFEG